MAVHVHWMVDDPYKLSDLQQLSEAMQVVCNTGIMGPAQNIGRPTIVKQFVDLARADAISETDLRAFEFDLLDVLGYGINFDTDTIENSEFKDSVSYSYMPEKGFHATNHDNGFSAQEILSIKNRSLESIDKIKLKQLSQIAISACLDGRELSSRDIFKKLKI